MANGFAPKITTIKGISERRRLPRLGRIRLGIKVPNKGSDPSRCECKGIGCYKCTHPVETSYFVVPPEVKKVYGDKPTELDIMAPVNDLDIVFPNAYKFYGSSKGLKCHGNLEVAYRLNEETKEMEQIECPCKLKDSKCKANANLQVILYKVNMGGVYQISSGSFNSMVDIPSGLEFTQCLIGRFAMVPLKLKRMATITYHDGKKQTHYPLQIHLDTVDLNFINTLREQSRIIAAPQYLLKPPEEIRPDLDGPIITDWKEEEEPSPSPQSESSGAATRPENKNTHPENVFILPDSITCKEKWRLHGQEVSTKFCLNTCGKREGCKTLENLQNQERQVGEEG